MEKWQDSCGKNVLAPSGSGIRAAAAAIDSSAPKVFQRNRAHGKDLLDLDRVLSRARTKRSCGRKLQLRGWSGAVGTWARRRPENV